MALLFIPLQPVINIDKVLSIKSPFVNYKDEGTGSRYHLNSGQVGPALKPVNAGIRNSY